MNGLLQWKYRKRKSASTAKTYRAAYDLGEKLIQRHFVATLKCKESR